MAALIAFYRELIDTFGYYIQVKAAISEFHKMLSRLLTGATTRSSAFSFGQDDPNLPDAKYQYRRTFGEVLDASARDGPLKVTHRRSVIVLLVASWEDSYRKRIAKELGLAKNELESDLFHDLNKYRQAIVHAGGTLRTEPKALRLFRKGDQVSLTDDHMMQIFRALMDELNRISREHYDIDAEFLFDNPLNA